MVARSSELEKAHGWIEQFNNVNKESYNASGPNSRIGAQGAVIELVHYSSNSVVAGGQHNAIYDWNGNVVAGGIDNVNKLAEKENGGGL